MYFKKSSNKLILLLFIFSFYSKSFAADYVISVFDTISSQNVINTASRILKCREIFNPQTRPTNVRVQRISSFSIDPNGQRNNNARGLQHHEKSIEDFSKLSETTVDRIISDWQKSGYYSEKELEGVANLHRNLSPHRLKLISVESADGVFKFNSDISLFKPSSAEGLLFSAIRVYDSSSVMKSYGRKRSVPKLSDQEQVELAERVFEDFNLKQALLDLKIERSPYTWSLGLGDVSGKQQDALKTLFAQVADLLDLHYNNRDYFNLNNVESILKENVDIVFYAHELLVPYYMKTFDLSPLLGPNGYPLYYSKNKKNYYIFHIKGSDFIKKYFDLRYHQPLYGNINGLRNEKEIRNYYLSRLQLAIKQINADNYKISDFSDFLNKIKPLVEDYINFQNRVDKNEADFFNILARLILIRKSLPDDIFEQEITNQTKTDFLSLLEKVYGPKLYSEIDLPFFAMLELLLRDPISILVNRTHSLK